MKNIQLEYDNAKRRAKALKKKIKKQTQKLIHMAAAIELALSKKDLPTTKTERPLKPIPEKYLKKILEK